MEEDNSSPQHLESKLSPVGVIHLHGLKLKFESGIAATLGLSTVCTLIGKVPWDPGVYSSIRTWRCAIPMG